MQVGDATAAAYASHGAGRSPALTRAARGMKAEEIALRCAAVAPRVPCRDNPVADASSRFTLKATRGYQYPYCGLRCRFRSQVGSRCGRMDAGMLARGDAAGAWRPPSRSQLMSVLKGPFPPGRLRLSPRVDIIELVMVRILRAVKDR